MSTTLTKGQTYDLSGLIFRGWTAGDGCGHDGYNWQDYFHGPETSAEYLGPDEHGIEPTFDIREGSRAEIAAAVDAAGVSCPETVADACIAAWVAGEDWRAELARAVEFDRSHPGHVF